MKTKQKTKPKPAPKKKLPKIPAAPMKKLSELPKIKMPKTKAKLERSFSSCEKRYIKVDNSLYTDYQSAAYEDLASARTETTPRWAITKAYQALFMMCNSILVRKLGVYSKDHGCLLVALSHKKLIPEETLNAIHQILEKQEEAFTELQPEEAFFEEISNIRITRNDYLYLPKILHKTKATPNRIVEEVRELIRLLGETE